VRDAYVLFAFLLLPFLHPAFSKQSQAT
jgi:hypothetical protein